MDDRRRALLIDEDELSSFASLPYERNVSELLLHHPFEGNADVPIEDEDIKGTLVVGYHDTGGIRLGEMLSASYLDTYERDR